LCSVFHLLFIMNVGDERYAVFGPGNLFSVGLIRSVGSSLPETRGGMFHRRSAAPQKSQHIPHLAKNCRPHSTTLRHDLEDHVVARQAGPKSGRLFEHGNTQVAGNPQNSQQWRTDVQSSRACAGDRIDRRARIDGALPVFGLCSAFRQVHGEPL